jgi:hypothetical protein
VGLGWACPGWVDICGAIGVAGGQRRAPSGCWPISHACLLPPCFPHMVLCCFAAVLRCAVVCCIKCGPHHLPLPAESAGPVVVLLHPPAHPLWRLPLPRQPLPRWIPHEWGRLLPQRQPRWCASAPQRRHINLDRRGLLTLTFRPRRPFPRTAAEAEQTAPTPHTPRPTPRPGSH